jgi:hypothetical protein
VKDRRTLWAAHNNAAWCDSVCRAHGLGSEFREGLWLNRRPGPRYYPNAASLTPDLAGEALRAGLSELSGLSGDWGFKDSFHALDLAPLGFRPLFEAEWLYWPAGQAMPAAGDMRWTRVATAEALTAWEQAWAAGEEPGLPRVFVPPLLADADAAFLAGWRDDQLVAGVIANRTGEVIGVSNLFLPEGAGLTERASAVAAAGRAFPGLALVGYERDQDLSEMLALGFQSIGPLRVWLKIP